MEQFYFFCVIMIVFLIFMFFQINSLRTKNGITISYLLGNKKGSIFRDDTVNLIGHFIDGLEVGNQWSYLRISNRYKNLILKISRGVDFKIKDNGYLSFSNHIGYTSESQDEIIILTILPLEDGVTICK